MFGNPASKLQGLIAKAAKSLDERKEKECSQHADDALDFIRRNEKEASIDFLLAQLHLGILLIQIDRGGQGFALMQNCIERAERFKQDTTAFYALACHRFAEQLRQLTEGQEQKSREALEKGLRRALEGNKEQLTRLLDILRAYLQEIVAADCSAWLPKYLGLAQKAYEREFGPDSLQLCNVLCSFAEFMNEGDRDDQKPQALKAIDDAHRIALAKKIDDGQMAAIITLKSLLLNSSGQVEAACRLLREALVSIKGSMVANLAFIGAEFELKNGQDVQKVEQIVDLGVKAAIESGDRKTKAMLLGTKGKCAGLRGDASAAWQCLDEIEKLLAGDSKNKVGENAETGMYLMRNVASGLSHGGLPEAALQVIERANLEKAGSGGFSEGLQAALLAKAMILVRLGRHADAEALLFDDVLERLDDINLLDTRRHAEALIELGDTLIEKGEHGRARAVLKSAWGMTAEREGKTSEIAGQILVTMGKLFIRLKQAPQAKESLSLARAALQAHGAMGMKARAIFEEFRKMRIQPES